MSDKELLDDLFATFAVVGVALIVVGLIMGLIGVIHLMWSMGGLAGVVITLILFGILCLIIAAALISYAADHDENTIREMV